MKLKNKKYKEKSKVKLNWRDVGFVILALWLLHKKWLILKYSNSSNFHQYSNKNKRNILALPFFLFLKKR